MYQELESSFVLELGFDRTRCRLMSPNFLSVEGGMDDGMNGWSERIKE